MDNVLRVIDLGDDPIPTYSPKFLFLFHFYLVDMKSVARNLNFILQRALTTERFRSWHYAVWLRDCLAEAYQLNRVQLEPLDETETENDVAEECEATKGLYDACQKLLLMLRACESTETFVADCFATVDDSAFQLLVLDVNAYITTLFRTAKEAKRARSNTTACATVAALSSTAPDNGRHETSTRRQTEKTFSALTRENCDAVISQHKIVWSIFWRLYYFLAFSYCANDESFSSFASSYQHVPQLVKGILRRPAVSLATLFSHMRTSSFAAPSREKVGNETKAGAGAGAGLGSGAGAEASSEQDLQSSVLNIPSSSIPIVFWLSTALQLFRAHLARVQRYVAVCARTSRRTSKNVSSEKWLDSKYVVDEEASKVLKKRCNFGEQRASGRETDETRASRARNSDDGKCPRLRVQNGVVSKFEVFLRSLRSHNFGEFRDSFLENVSTNNCIFLDYANNVTNLGLQFPKVALITSTPTAMPGTSHFKAKASAGATSAQPVNVTLDYKQTEVTLNDEADQAILLFRFLFVICRSWADTYLRSVKYIDVASQKRHTRKVRETLEMITGEARFVVKALVTQCERSNESCEGTFPVAIAMQIIGAIEPELRYVFYGLGDIMLEKTCLAKELDQKIRDAAKRESTAPKSRKRSDR